MVVTYGIYYSNGYSDIPMWFQEETREEISFFNVVCGIGLHPENQLERSARECLETVCGAMFLKNQYRWWIEALSRTRYSNRAPVVIDPRLRCIFVGPRPLQRETYVRYDILEQVWIQWYAFLVRRVRINPRQGSPIAMVRIQPLINVLDSPHIARWPAQYTSETRRAHGRASAAINNTDEFNAYQAFIAWNVFCREPWENFFKILFRQTSSRQDWK